MSRQLRLLVAPIILFAGLALPAAASAIPTYISPITINSTPAPVVGNTLTANQAVYTGYTTLTNQWQWCTANQTNCYDIPGATGLSYTVQSAYVGDLITVEAQACDSSGCDTDQSYYDGPVTARPANLWLFGDGSSIQPWSALGGGCQCANYNTASTNGRYRGDGYFNVTAPGDATNHVALELYSPVPPPNQGWGWSVEDMNDGVHPQPSVSGPWDGYYAFSVYVPSGGITVPVGNGTVNIFEPMMQNVGGQPPVCLMLKSDGSVHVNVLGGAYSSTGGFQYSPGHGNAPNVNIVPTGGLKPGWNDLAFHVHWTTDNTGEADYWFKPPGGSWTQTATYSGFPTKLWVSGSAPPTNYTDNLANYTTGAVTTPFALYFTDEAIELNGGSVASVESVLP